MSGRLCVKCGYDLSALPKEGTVVTCPECELATDLAVSPPVRENVFTPFLWAMVPMAPCAVSVAIGLARGERFGSFARTFLVLGLLCGAIIAGGQMHKTIGRQIEKGHAPMPRGELPALSMTVGLVSVVLNAVVIAGIYFTVFLFTRL